MTTTTDKETKLIYTALELSRAAREVLRQDMAAGKRPADFSKLHKWSEDIKILEGWVQQ